ncbi:MAG TPA: hypothetical protein GX525_07475 [Bacilli bacterium]|nr:hypothetical protein [Bacilli bacterium]
MAEIDNCPLCGRIFVRALRPVCESCFREYEKMFQTVYTFIRKKENREATIQEVVEHTGVEEEYIQQFIREGRIKTSQFPNLYYPCESCGSPIREGRICDKCKQNIYDGLKKEDREKRFIERKQNHAKQAQRERYKTYHSLDDRLKEKER